MNMTSKKEEKMSIDDILDSIKKVMNNRSFDQEEEDLEEDLFEDEYDEVDPIEGFREEELTLTVVAENDNDPANDPRNTSRKAKNKESKSSKPNVNAKKEEEEEESIYLNSIISKATQEHTEAVLKDFAETAETLGHKLNENENSQEPEQKTIEKFMMELLKPQIKSWMDQNLPVIVKEIVAEEVKNMVANMNKGRK